MIHHNEALGLDIRADSVRAVLAARRLTGLVLKSSASADLPAEGPARDQALCSFINEHGWSALPCAIHVGGEFFVLQTVDVEPGDPRSTEEIIALETDQFDQLIEKGTVNDHYDLGTVAGHHTVLVAMGRASGVQNAMQAAGTAQLDIVDVIPLPVVLFNALSEFCPGLKGTTVLVQVTGHGTELVVGDGRRPLFARHFPVGSDDIGDAVDGEEPEELARWLSELKFCLSLYEATHAGASLVPNRILIMLERGDAQLFVDRVHSETGVQTMTLGELGRENGFPEAARYAVAAGLAVGAVGSSAAPLSLLPEPCREIVRLRLQKKFWMLSGAAAALGLLAVAFGYHRRLVLHEATLKDMRARLSTRHALEEGVKTYELQNEALLRQMAPFTAAVHNGEILRVVLQAVAGARGDDDWITLVADERSYFDGEEDPDDVVTRAFERIVVEGYSPVDDFSTVRAMIEKLRDSPGIVDADVLGDDRISANPDRDQRWAGMGCSLFAIEITIPTP